MSSPSIGIYSYQIDHFGTLDSSALGCPSDNGEGPGSPQTDECGGGGASHASTGGIAGKLLDTSICDGRIRLS